MRRIVCNCFCCCCCLSAAESARVADAGCRSSRHRVDSRRCRLRGTCCCRLLTLSSVMRWRPAGDAQGRRCPATPRVRPPTAAPSSDTPNPTRTFVTPRGVVGQKSRGGKKLLFSQTHTANLEKEFQQTVANFRQKRLSVFKVSICPLNFPKIGVFSSNNTTIFRQENFPTIFL